MKGLKVPSRKSIELIECWSTPTRMVSKDPVLHKCYVRNVRYTAPPPRPKVSFCLFLDPFHGDRLSASSLLDQVRLMVVFLDHRAFYTKVWPLYGARIDGSRRMRIQNKLWLICRCGICSARFVGNAY